MASEVVALLPGDGIGPEVAAEARLVLEQLESEPRLLGNLRTDAVARQEDDDFSTTHLQAHPPRVSAADARADAA